VICLIESIAMNNVYKIHIINENIVATHRRHNPIPISAFLLQVRGNIMDFHDNN
jgi:hypothetical protein